MADGIEIELKLVLPPAATDTLLGADWLRAASPANTALAATYHDTPDGWLRRAGYSLRVRDEGGRLVQAVKATGAAAGLFARPEWECDANADGSPRFDHGAGPLGELLPDTVRFALAPAFTTEVDRHEARVERDGATVMVAVDRGAVVAGKRKAAFGEVELELIRGPSAALFELARAVNAIVPVRLGVRTKAERGYVLAGGGDGKSVKAEPVALAGDMTAGEAFRTIAHACLRQFRLNEDLLIIRSEAAALHQARVGLRRLRSAFSLFRPLFAADPAADGFRAELRWLQGVLGEARDLDVLATHVPPGPEQARVAHARTEAYARVGKTLDGDHVRGLTIDLVEWLALGGWTTDALAAEPIGDRAEAILDRQRRRVRKGGRHLKRLDDHHRHQVRIEAKKLRYATEFFAALFSGNKQHRRHGRFLAALERLQQELGTLNDLATAPRLVAELGLAPPPVPVPADRVDALLADAADAHDAFADARPFWR